MDLRDAVWRKSTRSNPNDNCVEVAELGDGMAVRDSKNPAGGALTFTAGEWVGFIERVKAGDYDPA